MIFSIHECEFEYFPQKFIYSEKATKFCEIFTLLLTGTKQDKSKLKMSQNFVAFSEYMNFKTNFDSSMKFSFLVIPTQFQLFGKFDTWQEYSKGCFSIQILQTTENTTRNFNISILRQKASQGCLLIRKNTLNLKIHTYIDALQVFLEYFGTQRVMPKICSLAKYQNCHSSKSIGVIKLYFC